MRPHELRAHRKAMKMTQTALGEWLGLKAGEPRRSIHDYEAGRRDIPGTVARAVTLEIENRALRAQVETLSRTIMGVTKRRKKKTAPRFDPGEGILTS